MAFKIVLDPGHGQYGNLGVTKGYYEGTQMYKLAYHLKAELEKYKDVTITMTRKAVSNNPRLATRGKMAKGHDLYLSIHSNAPGASAKKDGTYNLIAGTSVYDSVTHPNKALADVIGRAIAKVMGHKYKGTNYRKGRTGADYYGVLRNAIKVGCPSAMLIEHGFHTNPADCNFLLQDENLKKIARAEAEIIAKHYKLQLKAPATLLPKPAPNPTPKPQVKNPKVNIKVDGYWGTETTRALQIILGTTVDGYISNQRRNSITSVITRGITFGTGGSMVIRALQRLVGASVDGNLGPETVRKLQIYLGTIVDGKLSEPSMVVKEMQKRLNAGKL